MNYGYIPSPEDKRDYTLETFGMSAKKEYPEEFIIDNIPDIYDQRNTSMCVAFALSAIKESQELKERGNKERYSPGFIYGNRGEYDYEGEGMIPRQALKKLKEDGVCTFEKCNVMGTYNTCKARIPYIDIEEDCKPQRVLSYLRLNTIDEVKETLMNVGAVLLGVDVYKYIKVDSRGVIAEPKSTEKTSGHAMVIVGWKKFNGREYYIVNNSWGTDFADNGRCYLGVDSRTIKEMWAITDLVPQKKQEELKRIELWVDNKTYMVNGVIKNMDTEVFIKDDRAFVPIRFVAEELGAVVNWDEKQRKITIIGGMN